MRTRASQDGQPVGPKRTADYEANLAQQCGWAKLPTPEREVRVCPERKFRFDLAWVSRKLALEVDGGVWINGRHSRGAGIQSDCEKFSLAAIHGWRVLRVTPSMVKSGKALRFIEQALA